MSKSEDKKPVELKADLVAASEKIAPGWKVDTSTGVMTLDAGVIESMLPEGQTLESHLEHQKTMDLIKHALGHSGSQVAGKTFKDNKNLEAITFHTPTGVGKNFMEGEFRRHGVSRPVGGGEATTYAGAISYVKHEVISTRTKAEWNHIKDQFKAAALELGL